MNTRTLGRPEADEIPSHYVGYIKLVPELDPVIVCAEQIEQTATLLRGVSEVDALYRYDRGKWSIKEVVGHLTDVERIMAYRALRSTFDADAWRRRGTASGKPVSVRALAFMIPGHERHHVEILRTRYRVGEGARK